MQNQECIALLPTTDRVPPRSTFSGKINNDSTSRDEGELQLQIECKNNTYTQALQIAITILHPSRNEITIKQTTRTYALHGAPSPRPDLRTQIKTTTTRRRRGSNVVARAQLRRLLPTTPPFHSICRGSLSFLKLLLPMNIMVHLVRGKV